MWYGQQSFFENLFIFVHHFMGSVSKYWEEVARCCQRWLAAASSVYSNLSHHGQVGRLTRRVQTVPDLLWLTWSFSTLWRCKSDMRLVETVFWIWIFSQASDMQSPPLSWCWATAASAAPRQPRDPEGQKPIHLQPLCTWTLCFSLSVQCSVNYVRYSTLYYKIDFVLDDFAQL